MTLINTSPVHQLALLSKFLVYMRSKYGVCRLSTTRVGCFKSGPLGAVAYSPETHLSSLGLPRGPSAGSMRLLAGLQVGQAFRVLLLPGFGVGSSSPKVPGSPTSVCDSGVKAHKKAKDVLAQCQAIIKLKSKKV